MKLSLTVEADSINVLALNMGRIAVDNPWISFQPLGWISFAPLVTSSF